jgi:hypothetical protein
MPNSDWHQFITMHKIRVGGGVAGLIVVIGFLATGLVGIPMLRYFLGLAIAVGVGVALGMYWMRRWMRS